MKIEADPWSFARAWQDGWNSHDLDQIMAHYDQKVIFHSARAKAITSDTKVIGIAALRAYWAQALKAQPTLHFTVQEVFLGPQTLILRYCTHRKDCVAEVLHFNQDQKVILGYACRATDHHS